jgi:hypothetical protein
VGKHLHSRSRRVQSAKEIVGRLSEGQPGPAGGFINK